ncbi:hypothetical protein BDF21DRAFT_418823 [Thamnidium elegans]|nr:hypothetical protein BDF21DRAFT_418823 [Thamnidium elegans]
MYLIVVVFRCFVYFVISCAMVAYFANNWYFITINIIPSFFWFCRILYERDKYNIFIMGYTIIVAGSRRRCT